MKRPTIEYIESVVTEFKKENNIDGRRRYDEQSLERLCKSVENYRDLMIDEKDEMNLRIMNDFINFAEENKSFSTNIYMICNARILSEELINEFYSSDQQIKDNFCNEVIPRINKDQKIFLSNEGIKVKECSVKDRSLDATIIIHMKSNKKETLNIKIDNCLSENEYQTTSIEVSYLLSRYDLLGDFSIEDDVIKYGNEGHTLNEKEYITIVNYVGAKDYTIKGSVSIDSFIAGYNYENEDERFEDVIDAAIRKDPERIKESLLENEHPDMKINKDSISYDDTSYVNNKVSNFFIDFSFETNSNDFSGIDYYGDLIFGYDNLRNNCLNVKFTLNNK